LEEEPDFGALTAHHADGWGAEPRLRVVTDTTEQAANALLVVAGRFMLVGQSWTSHSIKPHGTTWNQKGIGHHKSAVFVGRPQAFDMSPIEQYRYTSSPMRLMTSVYFS
jgi:hypothetical protein